MKMRDGLGRETSAPLGLQRLTEGIAGPGGQDRRFRGGEGSCVAVKRKREKRPEAVR